MMERPKAVPLQAWSGPEGSRKLRFPDFRKGQNVRLNIKYDPINQKQRDDGRGTQTEVKIQH
jgi:hypothetical protein